MTRTHFVVGTAGHVDHGKTSLVRALTGVDCDRLPEEKKRGISIELGFARWDLEKLSISVIDVPGHERFVRAMVAGAAGIDAVILVVAADDGVMPQTREHLAICELLGVRVGVVAITKADAVDDELLGLVRDDVRSLVAGTFLEDARVVDCSSVDGRGLDALRAALVYALGGCPGRSTSGPVFLPIDRVFSVQGFGLVATGTLLRGELRVGDDLDALPDPRGGVLSGLKIRGLQVHDRAVERVEAASRVAVNLRGDVEGLRRGMALCSPGWQRPTGDLIAEVSLLRSADAIERRASFMAHLGTAQAPAVATVIGAERIEPGARGLVRLQTDAPLAAFSGQRLVLRQPDRDDLRTVCGGAVVDPHPRPFKGSPGRWEISSFYRAATAESRAWALTSSCRERGLPLSEARRRLPPDDPVDKALASLVKKQLVFAVSGDDPVHVNAEIIDRVEPLLLDRLARFHRDHPLVSGVAAAELLGGLPPLLAPWGQVTVRRLTDRKVTAEQGGLVRLASHDPGVGEALGKLQELYERAGLTPPSDDEAQREVKLSPAGFRDAIAELRRRGALKASGGLYFAASCVDALKARVSAYFDGHAELSAPAFKDLAGGLSRKHAIPLLELLDAEAITRRKGDVRVVGPAARKPPA